MDDEVALLDLLVFPSLRAFRLSITYLTDFYIHFYMVARIEIESTVASHTHTVTVMGFSGCSYTSV